MDSKSSFFKVLIFPWLAHGHIYPLLELSKGLSKKNFKVYFCSTSVNLDSINKSLDDSSVEMVELELPSMPDLPPQYHTTKNIPPHLMPLLVEAFQNSSTNFYDVMDRVKPDLLVYDGFQPWAAKFAQSRGIPAVLFSVSSVTSFAFFHHAHTHRGSATFPYPAIYLKDYEIMNLKAPRETMKVKDAGEGYLYGVFKLSHEIVLFKGCSFVEGKYMEYLSELCNKKIVPVGHLVGHIDDDEGESETLNWLDGKAERSTLYISFGSEIYLSGEEMKAIARGLELSEVNFIWVARTPSNGSSVEETLPEGFLDRVKGRGIVETGWAPQIRILAHPNVGGFMSHCGWGSVLESMYFGVPILALPMKLEQPLNARMAVEAGVGMEVARDATGQLNAEGVAEAISKVFDGKNGGGLWCKAKELSEKMKMEQEETFDQVVEQLSSICAKTS